ncbi:hypothetical protein EJB05_04400, partial [Eragrostis curvula]
MSDGEDRRDLGKFVDGLMRHVPGYVEQLMRETEASGRAKVKWLVGDLTMAMCFEAASRLGVRVAGFGPASAACFATTIKIPQLIEDGFIDEKGSPMQHSSFDLAPGMPKLWPTQMAWHIDGASEGQKALFRMLSENAQAASKFAEIVVCNSFLDAEAAVFDHFPSIEELCSKVEQIIGDMGIGERARKLKDAACKCLNEDGGSSHENFNRVVQQDATSGR